MQACNAAIENTHISQIAKDGISQVNNGERRPKGELIELFRTSVQSDKVHLSEAARQAIILKYREIALRMAKGFLRRWRVHLPKDELGSLVDLALCEAASRFCAGHGAKFTTFLYYYLKGVLVRTISRKTADPHIMLEDVSSELNLAVSQYQAASSEWQGELDPFSRKAGGRADAAMYRRQLKSMAENAMSQLSSLEQKVIREVYLKDRPLIQVAEHLGYSRSHVSRVRNNALGKLRQRIKRKVAAVA